MGWPLIGNIWSFLFAFKFGKPESFLFSFITSPTIIVTTLETSRLVLMDDAQFKPRSPKRRTQASPHRLTATPISCQKAFSVYHEFIKHVIETSLDELAKAEKPVEFWTEIRKMAAFKIIVYIFVSYESGPMIELKGEKNAILNHRLRSMTINLPGFAYHKALKAQKKLVAILQALIDGRRARKGSDLLEEKAKMVDLLMEVEDENGRKMEDEKIIDVILMYLNAGHESSAHTILWALLEFTKNSMIETINLTKRQLFERTSDYSAKPFYIARYEMDGVIYYYRAIINISCHNKLAQFLPDPSKYSAKMWFNFDGKPARFSVYKFDVVTRLCYKSHTVPGGNVPVEQLHHSPIIRDDQSPSSPHPQSQSQPQAQPQHDWFSA
ncbi:hypothetical protein UlMin_001101 [Ulmus minor]